MSDNKSDCWCWVQFGDLHIQNRDDENYQDFLALIEEANQHLAENVDFAFLPDDNADDGSEAQYQPIRKHLISESTKWGG